MLTFKSLIQWNIDGFFHRLAMLQYLISEQSPDIISLQETNLTPENKCSLKNYNCFRKDRVGPLRASGGVAIFTKNSIHAEIIPLNTNLEAVAIKISEEKVINVCNVYLPPGMSLTYDDIVDLINQIPTPRIITGDFNAHDISWGSFSTSPRGHLIRRAIDDLDCNILNDGSPTRFNTATGGSSAIDLSFCDAGLMPALFWEALPYTYSSDHFPIRIKNNRTHKPTCLFPPKWNLKQALWTPFAEYIQNRVSDCYIGEDIEKALEDFSNLILQSADLYIRRKKPIKDHCPVPWWSKACEEAIRASKTALTRYKRNKTLENKVEFSRLKAEAQRTVKSAKKASWRQYLSSINTSTPLSEVWRKVQKISGLRQPTFITGIKNNDKIITNGADVAELLAKTFHKYSSNDNYSAEFSARKTASENDLTFSNVNNETNDDPINRLFTMSEFQCALDDMNDTSPGPDDIPTIFLKHLPPPAKKHLLDFFNYLWTNNKFPTKWSEAITVPILKNNKPRYDTESYRPISLTCSMSKLMEKIINKRLLWKLEHENLLINEQSGFRQNRSSIDNILDLESDIHEALGTKQECVAIFFDLQRAFDTAWRFNIVNKLHSWNIRGNCLAFVRNFLENRSYRVRVNTSYSTPHIQENGTPQGAILSPTLFLVAINDIIKDLEKPLKARIYADDLVVFVKGSQARNMSDLLQTFLDNLEKWSLSTGFKFSPTKTNCIVFSKKQTHQMRALKLYNERLEFKSGVRFMGMLFDQKLTWKEHIRHLALACNRRLNLLRTLSSRDWGSDQTALLLLYRSLIRSKMDYGSIAYSSASKTTLKLLDPIHNTGIRIALGAFRTTPVQSLYSASGEPSLYLRRKLLTLTHASSIASNRSNPLYNNLFTDRYQNQFTNKPSIAKPYYERLRNILSESNLSIPCVFPTKSDHPPPWTVNIPKCNLRLTEYNKSDTNRSQLITAFNTIIDSKYHNFVKIYTDASKTIDGVGAAFVTHEVPYLFRLPDVSSIFTAELCAIFKAISFTNNNNIPKALILSDSLSSLLALQDLYPKHPIAKMIKTELLRTQQHARTIKFFWIPSHIGISGNEEADKSARLAVTSANSEVVSKCAKSDLKPFYKTSLWKKWEWEWKQSQGKLRLIKDDVLPWTPITENRRHQTVITRLRLGHTRFTHEHIFKREGAPMCEECNIQQSVRHVLVECPKYSVQRTNYKLNGQLRDILAKDCNTDQIISFLSSINMLYKI